MASRRQLPGAPSSKRYSEQVSAGPSSSQQQRSSKPLCRGPHLNRFPQPDRVTRHAVGPPLNTTSERWPLRSRLQPSTGSAINRSELPQSSIHISQPRGQKRGREARDLSDTKRRRTSDAPAVPRDQLQNNRGIDPIDHWRRSGYCWPQGHWSKNSIDSNPAVSHISARKKLTGSLRRKRSDSKPANEGSDTPSDQKSREVKNAPYRDARYEALLATKGSFMGKGPLDITDTSKGICRNLLEASQPVPEDTMFRNDLFEETCEALRTRNEARVIRDISLLIVPSAERLAIRGDKHLRCLIESVNEGWNNSISLTATRPQPDYSVGFRREAFTEKQLKKLQPFVGELTDQSFFMATYYLYFPFLTCEVKCGAAALDVADRQNAHSMTLAVRAVVELFRLVKREKELNRETLAFSISHDHRSVRIYGHFAIIEETKTSFYRHPIHTFDFTTLEGKDKWTAYKFTKNVYHSWMPTHFARICSAINALPTDVNFELSQQSDLNFSEQTGLSQDLANQNLSALNTKSGFSAQDDNSLSQPLDPLETPDTSFTKDSAQGGTKKAKRGRR